MFDQADFDRAECAYEKQRMIDCENKYYFSDGDRMNEEDYEDDDE